jgi:heat shock protein HslJ
MKFLAPISLLFLITVSCSASKAGMKKSQVQQNTLSGNYIITEVQGTKLSTDNLIIDFDSKSNQVNGFAGCNNFFGSFTVAENKLSFGAIAATKRYCQQEVNKIENDILNTLNKTNTFLIESDTLYLKANDKVLLKAKVNKTDPL